MLPTTSSFSLPVNLLIRNDQRDARLVFLTTSLFSFTYRCLCALGSCRRASRRLSAILARHRHYLRMLERFYWWVRKSILYTTRRWFRICLKGLVRKPSRLTGNRLSRRSRPGNTISVNDVGLLPVTLRGNAYILLFTGRFSRRVDLLAVTADEYAAEDFADDLMYQYSRRTAPSTARSLRTLFTRLLTFVKIATGPEPPGRNRWCEARQSHVGANAGYGRGGALRSLGCSTATIKSKRV